MTFYPSPDHGRSFPEAGKLRRRDASTHPAPPPFMARSDARQLRLKTAV